MILTNRLFERQAPSREAKSIYIFCEGARREYDYFRYFSGLDSRVKVEVNKLSPEENNSPKGLYTLAVQSFSGEHARYQCEENDEVWIVLDTDPDKMNSREVQIEEVKQACIQKKGWYFAESNPCFEVWLFFHQRDKVEEFEADNTCKAWKQKVNQCYTGGFDARKHPIFLEEAHINAQKSYQSNENGRPKKGSTDIHALASHLLTILKKKISEIKRQIQPNS